MNPLLTIRTRNAFTLVETLLVIALLGLGAGFAMVRFPALGEAFAQRTPADTLFDAIAEARLLAREDKATTTLLYDTENQTLRIVDLSGVVLAEHPFDKDDDVETLRFYPLLADRSRDGPIERETAPTPLRQLTFTPQGASQAILAVLERTDATTSWWLDPFSDTPLEIEP